MKVDLGEFNETQYRKWPRNFMLGTVVHYKDQNIYAFELWPGDNMPAEGIVKCWKLLSNALPLAKPLRWRACGATHESVIREALQEKNLDPAYKKDLEKLLNEAMITNEQLFAGVTYQPLTVGVTIGTVRILRNVNTQDPDRLFALNKDDILVSDDIPNDLPAVRALITTQLQTPLCHVALLCANRRAPNIAVRNALTDFAPFEGKRVKLTCSLLDYQVAMATDQDYEEWKASPAGQRTLNPLRSSRAAIPLSCNDVIKGLIDIAPLQAVGEIEAVEGAIGAKASQIARLQKVSSLPAHCFTVITPAFVIPFHYYQNHVKNAIPLQDGERVPMEKLIAAADTLQTRDIASKLGTVQQQLIESDHFDEELLKLVIKRLEDGLAPGGWLEHAGGAIFRSSTNVEDLPGFNGAGLYLSEPLKKDDLRDAEKVAETIKRVWASVWTTRGFMERSDFGLDQRRVRMAILVMPFLDATRLVCNGVCITANPFRFDFPGHYINSQVAGTAVTDNCQGQVAEQILVYDDTDPAPETLATSSLTQGKPILLPDEIIHSLFPAFKALHKAFAVKKKENNLKHAVDIEFLLLNNPERHLVILQCRPTTVTYQK